MENEELTKNAKESLKSKARRFRGWRGLNSSILLIAFFAPWLRDCHGDVYSGYQQTAEFIINIRVLFMGAIGGVSFIVYALLNLVLAVTGRQRQNLSWLIVPLVDTVYFLIYALGNAHHFFWGYWLAWGGVLSSLLLEWMERSFKREHNQEETPP